MKRCLLTLLLSVTLVGLISAQTYTIDNFDNSVADSLYEINVEGPPSYIGLADDHVDFVEGTGAMDVNYVIGEFHQWGSFANLIYRTDSTETLDWAVSDSFSIWIKVEEAPTHPEYMVFRIHIADRPNPNDDIEEYIYENTVVFDTQVDWFELKIPFYERPTDGTVIPNDSGFVLFPDTWGGGSYNNRELDRDAIVGYNLSAVVSGWDPNNNLPADSVKISYDSFTRFGSRAVPFIIFNGMALPQDFTIFTWGQSALNVEEGAGIPDTSGAPTNALKWVQGDEWGNGWTGAGFNIGTPRNMLGSWRAGDSVKFNLKAESGVGPIRIQFESGSDGKVGHVFTPIDDNQWHDYALPLQDFTYQDGTTNFDTTSVIVTQIMAEASGVAGKVVYIDNWWTGNPEIDVVAPPPPTSVFIVPDNYSNTVTWLDVPNETEETYNVYYSREQITDVSAPGVEVVDLGIGISENTQNKSHLLFSPLADSSVSYYYAVTCVDAAGNESDPNAPTSPVTNTAKGIATMSLNAPSNFVADGDLSEWSNIMAFRSFPSEGAHIVTNTTISGDGDLSVLTYLAADADYLYFAFDITDDVVDTTAANSWEKDSPDLYLGLYDWHGAPHSGYDRGREPDYHFRFLPTIMIIDNLGAAVVPTIEYHWGTQFPIGYVVEGKISWADLASVSGDDVFVPSQGYRIPFDLSFNDADGGGVREGIMTWSPHNDDNSWQSPKFWLHTWVGDSWITGINDIPGELPLTFELKQNYPNPFNPTTTITYHLAKQSNVRLDVFNTLGQKVETLVQEKQSAGIYNVRFDARNLATGIYFYRIQAENFVKVQKMILMK
ncbi:MAG: T9SS type A sorting domain-containing protein [Aliifodinibius sp.]|nr:T9SS type A sorting domain-containing protein [candidate division Zixibacteria bacterium]NIT61739.1 T9SS type A sorting domain-containing protein [Fodinibius sp.]NIW50184.1 T9SS type A sorting domain-containing protein [Gammaproteobacteria bacterium]NIS49101.1 T9SS type A sorting domain-containing protein [candidate division Zixibacteria bacterium]NIU17193.1 T9SS type A sorting domain-containing protein [candidate division Zixibacteria bacterium]